MFGSRCRQLAGDGGVCIIAELARCAGGITALETLSGAGGQYEAARELYVQMVGSATLTGTLGTCENCGRPRHRMQPVRKRLPSSKTRCKEVEEVV
jgi:hypothetical protein